MKIVSTPLSDEARMGRREAIRRTLLLLGVAISPGLLDAVEQIGTESGNAPQGKYLEPKTFAFLSALCERIIPRTDTPGALDVGVPTFIDLFYGRCMTVPDQQSFAAGLNEMLQACMPRGGMAYEAASPAEQDALLRDYAESSPAHGAFFRRVRNLTALGYFTSEVVQKEVLIYEPIPGRFDADLPGSEAGTRSRTL